MRCHIIRDKRTGEEFLIPGCYSVVNCMQQDMTDREVIKQHCICVRTKPKDDKYETKTRDEVFGMIEKMEGEIAKTESVLEKLKEDLEGLKSEVFMLNAEEVDLTEE